MRFTRANFFVFLTFPMTSCGGRLWTLRRLNRSCFSPELSGGSDC